MGSHVIKNVMLAGAAVLGLCLGLSAEVTKDELKHLAQAGLSEDVIRNYIKINGPVARLSSDDLIELRKSGLSDRMLAEILSAAPSAPAAPAPAPAPPPDPAPAAAPALDPNASRSAAGSLLAYDGTYYYPSSYFSGGFPNSSVSLVLPVLVPVEIPDHSATAPVILTRPSHHARGCDSGRGCRNELRRH